MQLLLDTHALLWYALDDPRLPAATRRGVMSPDNVVFASAASAWEIATKVRIGKLPPGPLATAFINTVRTHGVRVLPIGAQDARTPPGPPGDPFDRVLAAQALSRGLVLVSNDAVLDRFGVARLWA